MSEWKDISTAPKDGTKILAWGYMHDDGGPCDPDGMSWMGEMPDLMIAYWSEEYKAWINDGLGCSYEGLTHWQPTPKPPPLAIPPAR